MNQPLHLQRVDRIEACNVCRSVDEGWTEADGGALELYPLAPGAPHTPAVNPTVNLLPLWNTMAFFTVLPGRSFHAVQARSQRFPLPSDCCIWARCHIRAVC